MKYTNYGADHPFSVIRGRVAGLAAVGTATLSTLQLVVIDATISADTDDWNPAGLSTADVIRTTTTGAWLLSGLVAPGDDRLMILENIGANDLILVHDASSTAANRFLCPGDTAFTLDPDTGVWLRYDMTSARWRVESTVGSGGGSDGITPYYIAPGDSFTVPLYKQSLFEMTIDVGGTLVVDGFLILVT